VTASLLQYIVIVTKLLSFNSIVIVF